MNVELQKLYLEIEPYLVEDKEKYQYVLKDDAPEKIKEKYKKYKTMQDDLVVEPSE